MINITVFASNNVSIENTEYIIDSQNQMIKFLRDLVTKIKFGGEAICVEEANIVENRSGSLIVNFKEIERW